MDGVIMIDSNFLSLQTSFSTLSDNGMNRLNRIFESFYYDFSQTKLLFKSLTNLLSTIFEDFGLGLIHSPYMFNPIPGGWCNFDPPAAFSILHIENIFREPQ